MLSFKIINNIKNKIERYKSKRFKSFNINKSTTYTHVIHSGEGASALGHIDMWLPFFKEANVNFFVLVRSRSFFKLLTEQYPSLSIVYAKSDKAIDRVFEKHNSIKACFYPSNTGNNIHLLFHNNIEHIFIGHGDSDKLASAHKFFRVYDQNWVASEAHIDRFKNAGFDFSGLIMKKVGRPALKDILIVAKKDWRDRFNSNINILYLSTWEGHFNEHDYTSIYFIEEIINNFKKLKYNNFDIKMHPWIGKRDKTLLYKAHEIKTLSQELNMSINIHPKEKPISELIKHSNFFICDISAVVSECLAANAPIFVYIPKDKEIKLAKSNMSYEDYTYTYSSIDELMEKIEDVLSGNDYLAQNREKAMEYILGKDETLNSEFINQLKDIGK